MTNLMTAAPRTLEEKRAVLRALADRGEVLETPLEALRAHRLTPQALAFVRNSNPYPSGTETLGPVPLAGPLELGGLLDRSATLDLAELRALPRAEVEAVMQCAGNGRAFFSHAENIHGCQWTRGGVMNARWGGVRVRDLLAHVGAAPREDARFLTATGGDSPKRGGDPYEKSVPLDHALAHGLVAFEMNGEPLSGAHGGPARLVVPGFYGTVNVKWLRRLALAAEETRHEAQQERYRVGEGDASRPCWHQPLKSLIWTPLAGETVGAGAVTVEGCAFNDGGTPIARVEVSADGGATWHGAALDPEGGPFGWHRWAVRLPLAPGEHELWSRATDAEGRAQPLDPDANWNPDGYEFSSVDRVRVRVD